MWKDSYGHCHSPTASNLHLTIVRLSGRAEAQVQKPFQEFITLVEISNPLAAGAMMPQLACPVDHTSDFSMYKYSITLGLL